MYKKLETIEARPDDAGEGRSAMEEKASRDARAREEEHVRDVFGWRVVVLSREAHARHRLDTAKPRLHGRRQQERAVKDSAVARTEPGMDWACTCKVNLRVSFLLVHGHVSLPT